MSDKKIKKSKSNKKFISKSSASKNNKTKKKINTNNQTGGFANIEPTEQVYKSLQIGTDNINNKLSLYQLNGFPGSPPKPECTIM